MNTLLESRVPDALIDTTIEAINDDAITPHNVIWTNLHMAIDEAARFMRMRAAMTAEDWNAFHVAQRAFAVLRGLVPKSDWNDTTRGEIEQEK